MDVKIQKRKGEKMKKIALVILSMIFVFGMTSCVHLTPDQKESLERQFEGVWTVSGYEVGGVETRQYDGVTVRIVKNGDIYLVDGPTLFFAETKFKLSQWVFDWVLEGAMIPDLATLKEFFPMIPTNVLGEACGRVVFKGHIALKHNKLLKAKVDNIKIFYTNRGFHHVQEIPYYTQFDLIKK